MLGRSEKASANPRGGGAATPFPQSLDTNAHPEGALPLEVPVEGWNEAGLPDDCRTSALEKAGLPAAEEPASPVRGPGYSRLVPRLVAVC